MKTNKSLLFALLCALSLTFTACKDLDSDAKEAASAYCRRKEVEKGLIKTTVQHKEIAALLTKMNNIRKRYYNKTTRHFDKKFDEAFEKYKMECSK
jgi:hypothetical protein